MFFIWKFFRENVFALFWWFPTQYYYFGYCDLMFVLHFGCFWMNLLTFWVALIMITLRELRWSEPLFFRHNKRWKNFMNVIDLSYLIKNECSDRIFDWNHQFDRKKVEKVLFSIIQLNLFSILGWDWLCFRLRRTLNLDSAGKFLSIFEQKIEDFLKNLVSKDRRDS